MSQLVAWGPQTLHSGATTGNGGTFLILGHCDSLTIAVDVSTGVSAGVLKIEESYYDPNGPQYAGTWSVIQTLTTGTDFSAGSQAIYHSPAPAAFWAVRARISTAITGGTVTVTAWANS